MPSPDREPLVEDRASVSSRSQVNAACQTPADSGPSSFTTSFRAPSLHQNVPSPYGAPFSHPYYGTTNQYPYPPHLNPYYLEDIFTGIPKDGFISPVRRFFCLFVSFDLALTSLLWLMSVVITGGAILDGLRKEVLQFSIYTSLFDLVMSSSVRFTVLILLYAVLRMRHWLPVAMTTTGSCAFLLTKVFYFQWNSHSSTYMFDVFFVIVSFVLPWGEAWFLDFRVIPIEARAAESRLSFVLPWGEAWFLDFRVIPIEARAAEFFQGPGLLRPPFPEGAGAATVARTGAASTVLPFYSPQASPVPSVASSTETPPEAIRAQYTSKNKGPFTPEEVKFRETAMQLVPQAVDMLQSDQGWRFVQDSQVTGDTVMCKYFKKLGTVFRLTGFVDRFTPREILDELFYKFTEIPSWNSSILTARTLQIIDEFTDISYQLTGDQGGGLISSRDFVLLTGDQGGGLISSRDFVLVRHWTVFHNAYVTVSQSVRHSAMPPQPQCVRGENKIVCFHLEHFQEGTRLTWMLHTDLKGWIPKTVVDASLSAAMLGTLSCLRRRLIEIRGEDGVGLPAVP
ncbi:unnamed protein product [Cyprideis torosa]|uniref:Uncharacterized protein n=1 Tax=Cyprideis torosa TaxID=163714 RepID=A0A7R8WFW7_9CRUS|nr:unnamed protein product [Cyprideis torosa]CAG0897494.1 unnamed protein product [Cyprideis torosa]